MMDHAVRGSHDNAKSIRTAGYEIAIGSQMVQEYNESQTTHVSFPLLGFHPSMIYC